MDFVKEYGFQKLFEPLLHDLVTLEQEGVFIPQLGSFIKGTVQCIIADNLGAHGLAGFIEFLRKIFLPLLYSSAFRHPAAQGEIRSL